MNKEEQTKLITVLSQCMNQSFNDNLNSLFTKELASGLYTIIDRKIATVIHEQLSTEEGLTNESIESIIVK